MSKLYFYSYSFFFVIEQLKIKHNENFYMTSVFLIHFYNKRKYTKHLMNFNYSFVIKLIKQAQYSSNPIS
jgi:hypothetical protein